MAFYMSRLGALMKINLFTTHKLEDQAPTRRISGFLKIHHLEFNLVYIDDIPSSMILLRTLCFGKELTPSLLVEGVELLINPADYRLAQVFKIKTVLETYHLEIGGINSVDLIDSCDN